MRYKTKQLCLVDVSTRMHVGGEGRPSTPFQSKKERAGPRDLNWDNLWWGGDVALVVVVMVPTLTVSLISITGKESRVRRIIVKTLVNSLSFRWAAVALQDSVTPQNATVFLLLSVWIGFRASLVINVLKLCACTPSLLHKPFRSPIFRQFPRVNTSIGRLLTIARSAKMQLTKCSIWWMNWKATSNFSVSVSSFDFCGIFYRWNFFFDNCICFFEGPAVYEIDITSLRYYLPTFRLRFC